MKLQDGPRVDLTYCTNVHPGETWADTFASLEKYLPPIKALASPDAPMGVGLRLSAAAAEELEERGNIELFQSFLAEGGFYVFTINGFPFGSFHGTRVKENVYLPDWRDRERLDYSNRLASILVDLLPDDVEGSVSTVPGAYKPAIAGTADIETIVDNLVYHAGHLAMLEAQTGRTVRLALEPEPCCFLETVEETVRFFEDHVFSRRAAALAASITGRSERGAHDLLRRHVGVCFDVCHAAVEFEEDDALDRLAAAGIEVPKIQLSAALRLPHVDARARALLAPFDDGVYFHQVVERGEDGGFARYADLEEAFAARGGVGDREWRVHFHVPLFREDMGDFATTQDYLRTVLARQKREPVSTHLEIETYTWGVLPPEYRQGFLAADIAREIEWVKRELAG